MTPFKDNITKSIDNLNKLQEDVENTITDLQEQVEEMENLQTKDVTITENGTTEITPDSGYYALDKVNLTVDAGDSKVIIDNDVTYNSSYGFKTLITKIDLKDFTLPSSLTTLLQFVADFKNLEEIKNLTIPSEVTEMNSCFNGCSSLITIPNINTSNITRMQYCFNGCSSLENVPILDLSHITGSGLNSCFGNCPSLTNDSLHNIIKSLVNTIVSSNKRLAYIGLSSEQATICTTFDEWTTLSANGWTTGY